MGAVSRGYRGRSGTAGPHGRSKIVMETLRCLYKLAFSLTTSNLAKHEEGSDPLLSVRQALETNPPRLATWQRTGLRPRRPQREERRHYLCDLTFPCLGCPLVRRHFPDWRQRPERETESARHPGVSRA